MVNLTPAERMVELLEQVASGRLAISYDPETLLSQQLKAWADAHPDNVALGEFTLAFEGCRIAPPGPIKHYARRIVQEISEIAGLQPAA